MLERCPFCRARPRGEDICSRCGADLTLARRADRMARLAAAKSLEALSSGDLGAAEEMLRRSKRLRKDPNQRHIAALIRQARATEQKPPDGALAHGGPTPDIPPILPRRWWF